VPLHSREDQRENAITLKNLKMKSERDILKEESVEIKNKSKPMDIAPLVIAGKKKVTNARQLTLSKVQTVLQLIKQF
jgi:DNA sulfur modification protein DndD